MAYKKIKCAFCKGKGKDPFGVPSILSTCQVCGGRGTVSVMEPMKECAFCKGTGVDNVKRLTCHVCMGKGMVTVKPGAKKCPECNGDGHDKSPTMGYFPCSTCGGKGWA